MSPCPSPEVWSAWLESRLDPAERSRWSAHLASCPDCRGELAGWAEAASEAVPPEARRRWEVLLAPRRRLPYGIAAALLITLAGLSVLWRAAKAPPAAAPKPARREASLEVEPGGEASLSGHVLSLRSGSCWLDTTVPVVMESPLKIRFGAGTEAEVRVLPGPKAAWSLLGEAWAGAPPEVLVSVVSGCAQAGILRIPAGSRARLPEGRLEPLDAPAIDAWRSRRLEAGARGAERILKGGTSFPEARDAFAVEIRAVKGHVVLRYPSGETTLGVLDAWKDPAWHRLSVTWKGSGTEVFLDGRRILRLPKAAGAGMPALEILDGSLVFREIRP